MEKEQTKTIHLGYTEAKQLGKLLINYLLDDVETLDDFQSVYIKGYMDAIDEKLLPFSEKLMKHLEHMDKTLEECGEIIKQ